MYIISFDGGVFGVHSCCCLQEFDVVVGDVTILAHRSNYVDFAMPYTEASISMVVPIKDTKNDNALIFLKPFKLDLWVTTFCSFVAVAFVIWVLEHRINKSFRGPPSQQAGTSLWFAFSTMVFSPRNFHSPSDVINLLFSRYFSGHFFFLF